MAITWGSAVYSGGNGFRVGYEFSQSPSTVTSGTTSVVVTCKLYGQTQYYAYDSAVSWSISNQITASGTRSFSVSSGTSWSSSNIFYLGSGSRTVTTSTTSTVTTSISGALSGLVIFPGLVARCSGTYTTAKRPLTAPAAPTGCTASRVSDTQHTISWTNTSPTSSTAPYQHVEVQRQTDGGTWTTVATVGVVTSYSDKATSSNHKYAWRVRATNTAGASGYSAASSTLATTPAAPPTPTPVKGATNIVLNWTSDPPWATGIQVWHGTGSPITWDGAPLATVGGTTLTYTHASPSTSVSHSYRLAATTTTPALTGPYSGTSVTVNLTAPPNAPTNLSPAGVAVDQANAVTMTWKHNPVDTTLQTKYQVQHRVVGAGSWTLGSITTSATSSFTLPAATYSNGQQIEWQVRTWGQATTGGSDGTGASPFSSSAVLTLSSTPSATITSPAPVRSVTDGVLNSTTTVTSATANFTSADVGSSITGTGIPVGATITTINSTTSVIISAAATATASGVTLTITDLYNIAQMIVQWTYFDPESTTQQQAIATLYQSGSVLETATIPGSATSWTFQTPVANGGAYTVGVKVQDGSGLWSPEATQAFTVSYFLPPTPDFALEWYAPGEAVTLAINNPPTGVGQVDAVSTEVWRSIGGGPWVLIQSFTGLATSTIDYIPDLVQSNSYKVVAISALPSRVESAIVSIDSSSSPSVFQGIVVNGGPGFTQYVRLPYNPNVNRSVGRDRTLQKFAGREYPLEFTGEQRDHTINLQATISDQLVDTATFADIEFLADLPGAACYRDPAGKRVFVSMGKPDFGDTLKALRTVSWVLTRTDYNEAPAGSTYTVGFGVFYDDDGVPYFDPYRRNLVALDVDGVPYIVSGD